VVLKGAIEIFGLSELGSLAVDGIVCSLVDQGKLVGCYTYYATYIYFQPAVRESKILFAGDTHHG
jgi:hypothetical protein